MNKQTRKMLLELNERQLEGTRAEELPLPGVGRDHLPPYSSFADQLQRNGIIDGFDRSALSVAASMSMSMSMLPFQSMSMLPDRSFGSPQDDDEDYEENVSFDGLEYVRTDPGWIDYVYTNRFLRQTTLFDVRPECLKRFGEDFSPTEVSEEIEELLWKQSHPQREERMLDILIESVDYTPRFLYACGIDPHAHSKTYRLIETMSHVAYCVVMHYKYKYKRPRPSQVDRRIDPALRVPGHYSYPSGHATQAHLIEAALTDVFLGLNNSFGEHLEYEAKEIAQNREWAGVHYASDSKAGKQLAKAIWQEGGPSGPPGSPGSPSARGAFVDLLEQARAEWEPFGKPLGPLAPAEAELGPVGRPLHRKKRRTKKKSSKKKAGRRSAAKKRTTKKVTKKKVAKKKATKKKGTKKKGRR